MHHFTGLECANRGERIYGLSGNSRDIPIEGKAIP